MLEFYLICSILFLAVWAIPLSFVIKLKTAKFEFIFFLLINLVAIIYLFYKIGIASTYINPKQRAGEGFSYSMILIMYFTPISIVNAILLTLYTYYFGKNKGNDYE